MDIVIVIKDGREWGEETLLCKSQVQWEDYGKRSTKMIGPWLVWLGWALPNNRKVAGSVPTQGMCERRPVDVLSHITISLPISGID